ncbi:methyl-accepting chemotaxis protein [Azorhizobium doebereinerae]|uniref:methyl-accepting chemotaxis protein n=1 Tax=Azorhizobium doebereinerae TaxID=281091 RepID=UPI00040F00E5|nr:HAMP domain-containing methyl-accepting chemotaxis protein [Azorhizobium doebereinerae]
MMKLKLGIGLKLGIASAILILLSAGVIVSRQIAMSQIARATEDARLQARIFDQLQDVGLLLSRIRVSAAEMRLSFANLDNENMMKQVNKDVTAAKKRLDDTLAIETHEDDRQVFRKLQGLFEQIGVAIADVYKTETAQMDAMDARPGIRMAARVAFSNLANRLSELGDEDGAREVAPLEAILDQVNMASWSYIIEDDTKQLNLITVNEDTGRKAVDAVREKMGGIAMIAPDIDAARKAFDDYIQSVRDGLAQVQAREKILKDRAQPAMAEAAKILREVTDEGIQQSKEADEFANTALDNGMGQILIFSLIAILAAIGAAIYSVFGVARPIRHVSEAMEQVSDGDLSAHIPYEARRDEVGDQARALIVFRDGLAEAERQRELRTVEERAAAEARKAEMVALADSFEAAVGAVVETVASAASELQSAAETLTATAEETTTQATAVAAAAGLATSNVQTVAAAIEELSASAREIGARLSRSSEVAGRAVSEVDQTNGRMTELRGSADQIGTIVGLIDTIAGQTNLLALNATIESARAGEAGRGFAVVASEVKELASQTAKATADISERITGIQGSTGDVLGAITGIARTIGEISEGTTAIAAAMEEQNATTAEVSRNIQQAADGTNEVTSNIAGVERAAQASSTAAMQVLTSATDLSKQAVALRAEVQRFLDTVRAA